MGNPMYIDNKWLQTGFRLLLLGCCTCGLWLYFSIAAQWWSILSYYTIESNLAIGIFFVYLLVYKPSGCYYTLKGGATICIALTFLVYHFVLRPALFAMNGAIGSGTESIANLLLHYVVPLMTVADWLLFDKKGGLTWRDPLKWLAIPLAYFLFAVVRAQLSSVPETGSRYQYFFIDLDRFGAAQVALNCAVFAAGFAALGYLIYGVDAGLSKIPRKGSYC